MGLRREGIHRFGARRPAHRRARLGLGAAALLVIAVAGAWLAASIAGAASPTQAALTGTISPAVPSVGPAPRSVALSIVARFGTVPPGGQPATVTQAVISFSHGATVNSRLFPSCAPTVLDERGPSACPHGSRIGSGSATAAAAGTVEPLTIIAYNGPGGRSVVFYLVGVSPVRIATAINSPLVAVNSLFYAYQITLNVPQSLREIAGLPVAVTEFGVTIKATVAQRAKGRTVRRGFVEVPFCPPGAIVPLRGVFTFLGAPTETVNSGIDCGEPPPS